MTDAEDLFQETWLRLGPYDGLEAVRHPKAFLLKVAANLAADGFGKRRKEVHLLAELPLAGWGIALPAQTDEVLAKQLVLSLPQPLRDVFVLSRIGGLSNAQIGERLGISPESAYRAGAVSPVGAGGLTQLMPGTAAELGVTDRFDVEQNLSGGADYLARQLIRFGDVRLALAAYNSGPGRVARLGRIPDISETRNYVISVVDCYLALSAGRRVRNSRDCRSPEAGS